MGCHLHVVSDASQPRDGMRVERPVLGARRRPLLTDAELVVLAALEDLVDELGYAPTELQLLARVGWRSRSAVHEYLERLRAKGVVEGRGRSLRVIG